MSKHIVVIQKQLFVTVILLCVFSSCKKFLDQKPDKSVVVPSGITDLQALLDNSSRMNQQRTPAFSESSADEYFLPDATYLAFDEEIQSVYRWQRLPYNFQNDWSVAYEPVYTANFCLEQLEKIPVNVNNLQQWNNIKGSALFFRSYYFLCLSWTFSKAYHKDSASKHPGIVLRLNSDFNIPSVRATVQESYDRSINDAKESLFYLPDYPQHVMRPSKAAAYGLLARAYLSMGQYDSSFRYADLCLQLKNNLMDYNADADLNGSINAATPFKRFNKETIFYSEMSTLSTPTYVQRARIDTVLYASFHTDDLRQKAFFLSVPPYQQFKGSYTGNNNQFFTGLATDELYLIRAECAARRSDITAAMNDLNTLMQKRWSNTVPYPFITAINKDEALAKILAERKKELYMRGVRWSDIKRLNIEQANIILTLIIGGQTYTLLPNAGYYALPLPDDIIRLTGIAQNQ
jgi:hypothetical protein